MTERKRKNRREKTENSGKKERKKGCEHDLPSFFWAKNVTLQDRSFAANRVNNLGVHFLRSHEAVQSITVLESPTGWRADRVYD